MIRTLVEIGDPLEGIEEEHGGHEDAEDLDPAAHHPHHEHVHGNLLRQRRHNVPGFLHIAHRQISQTTHLTA